MTKLSRKQLEAIKHYYRQYRRQGEPALVAWLGARRHVAFRERLSADVAEHKRRSKAAKRAWKKRRAA